MSNVFNRVGGLRPKRNVFDLSYRKNFTCDMGQLIPVMCDEVVPGDYIKLGCELVVRFQPLAAPLMHEVKAHVHYFFVPYRILWEQWEDFIEQGQLDGEQDLPIQLPHAGLQIMPQTKYKIWDYLGLPVVDTQAPIGNPKGPIDFPWRAYNRVWNEYYRDQNLQLEVGDGVAVYPDGYPNAGTLIPFNWDILYRNWKKDYFTASLPFRQKGVAPALPVHVGYDSTKSDPQYDKLQYLTWYQQAYSPDDPNALAGGLQTSQSVSSGSTFSQSLMNPSSGQAIQAFSRAAINVFGLGDKLSSGLVAHTFDVSDMRLAFQTQKWLERNARAGTRYTEFLQAHFGVSPSDARLDRPEYIGGMSMPVMINEVVQTSETRPETNGTPQGTMAGHGLGADGQYCGDYNVQEYGVIIGLLSVMPKPAYQQGINRQWLRELPTDFYFPEFSHLSEQAVERQEILMSTDPELNRRIFGYVGQYDEMRVKHDMVCGDMRITTNLNGEIDPETGLPRPNENLSYWNLARFWNTDGRGDEYLIPHLNSEFITCKPDKRIFQVKDVHGLIVNCQNNIMATRPLPLIAEPGLIDHF